MAELSEDDKSEIDIIAKEATAELELDRQETHTIHEVSEREHKFTIWIVGLSVGAVAGLSVSPRLAAIPQWQAGIVFLFFVFSILSGTIYIWALKEFRARADYYHHATQSGFIAVLSGSLPRIKSSDGIKDARTRLQEIQKGKEPTILILRERAQVWISLQKHLQFVAPSAFVVGVVALAVVAWINWPQPFSGH